MMKNKKEKGKIKTNDKIKKKKSKKNNGKKNTEKNELQKYMDKLWGFSSSEDEKNVEEKHRNRNITDFKKEKEYNDNVLKNKLYENSDKKSNNLLIKSMKEKNNINMYSSEVCDTEEEKDEHTELNSNELVDNNFLFNSGNLKNNKSNQIQKDKKKVTFDKTTEIKKDSIINSNKSNSFYKNQDEKKNKFENSSLNKIKINTEVKHKDILNKEKEYKEKREMKKNFMDAVHEIRKLAIPHLNKFQRKNVENHQIKLLGGKFDKSQKIHYPELMQRKKSIKKYISKRKETEKILGVKLQTGDSIDMHDVLRKKNKNKKYKKKINLF
ncbi:conserved Plasmodium protein, unknown function [Plasmodium berghei]|uniref:Uncharacterized protein n=2 Tax=Plasmodium berghei TaxID=5821 RepID=A0A509AYK2_PLABA|nr:conserved protein, unknown function [Plasmodium berghei ANKA]CXJ05378.1 conserved Plasmodium protein, unknown function [Plasmodium berghei]SCL98806.1 conserved Plasmodium protein, unknown function [Plasmodium berghei]SCM16904.1 conserved Plasmodium protein, unknown function [Plasmodium berghei]SCM18702.1 conserved Plasmodium protein, unknown function [Plasmodium berghei]SCN28138.1 conserved Plasmodium protein, unknown function [Plasmodium berghei]|eukprot:XP_034423787.1 conserved protein, unknown function [Plasmodium berghei ANKA]